MPKADTDECPEDHVDWKDVLARLRSKVQEGADRIEWHLQSDTIRGMKEIGEAERGA